MHVVPKKSHKTIPFGTEEVHKHFSLNFHSSRKKNEKKNSKSTSVSVGYIHLFLACGCVFSSSFLTLLHTSSPLNMVLEI